MVLLYLDSLSEAALAENFPTYEVRGTEDALCFIHWINTQRFRAIDVSSVRQQWQVAWGTWTLFNTATAPTQK